MQKRCLGQTDIFVSPLGLGTVKFGRNQGVKYPASFELPTDADIQKLLGVASEAGINFLDTAPAYGSSEERLGKVLAGQRQNWVIASKVGEEFADGQSSFDFSESAITHSVERSLKRLKTDYLDIVLVHSSGDDELIIHQDQPFEVLTRLKQQGKIRGFGMSTKTVAGGMLACELSDVVMVTYREDYQDELSVIQKAEELGKGVLIKKALASGHIRQPVVDVMQFIFSQAAVTSVIVGTLNPEHLKANLEAVKAVVYFCHPGRA